MSKLIRYTRATIAFMGPVAGAVQGTLSKPEIARAVAKAVVVGTATGASMTSMATDQDFLTDIAVPLAAAVFTGLLDAMSRLNQGEPPDPKP